MNARQKKGKRAKKKMKRKEEGEKEYCEGKFITEKGEIEQRKKTEGEEAEGERKRKKARKKNGDILPVDNAAKFRAICLSFSFGNVRQSDARIKRRHSIFAGEEERP